MENKFYNTLITPEQYNSVENEINYLTEIGYGDLNLDAVWKWGTIINIVKSLGYYDKTFKCVDVGGGLSPLHLILSNYGEVTNIELGGFKKTWFPTKDKLYVNCSGLEYKKENINYIKGDFLTEVKKIEDNSIDFFYDSCSLIHFKPNKNEGFITALNEIKRKLKPGGHFVCVTDVAHPDFKEVYDMKHPETLINCVNSVDGLDFYGNVDFELHEFFKDLDNSDKPETRKKGLPIHKIKSIEGGNDNLPPYHLLFTKDMKRTGGITNIIRLIFTVQKK